MNFEWIRTHCMALPGTTETIQWGDDLVFKVGGKMYAVAVMSLRYDTRMSFKCSPEEFAELIEVPGCVPAPYLARAHWVAIQDEDALPRAEIKKRLTRAYELVKAKLPKKAQAELAAPVKKVAVKKKAAKRS